MEHDKNLQTAAPSPEAAPNGSVPPPAPARIEPPTDLGPLLSDCLTETFAGDGRKPRHDGWTAERIGGFLLTRAGTATVEAAARSVGLSVASAYAFRNRRQGRSFAKMWDAILIHRARVRIAAENSARAVNGIVSKRVRDGVVVEELHHHDNRLSMAMLTRLDRLAERESANDEHLRALAERLDDYILCLESGGDPDDFIDSLKPGPPPEPAPPPTRADVEEYDEFDRLARLAGCPSWRDVPAIEIPVEDLDFDDRGNWTDEQWIRAHRSGFLFWKEHLDDGEPEPRPIAADTRRFIRARAWAETRRAMAEAGEAAVRVDDLHPEVMADWNDDQWQRAEASGLLERLPEQAWVEITNESEASAATEPGQSSTSSTFPDSGEEEEGG